MQLTPTQQRILDHLTNVGPLSCMDHKQVKVASVSALKVQIHFMRQAGCKITTVRTLNRYVPNNNISKGRPGVYRLTHGS